MSLVSVIIPYYKKIKYIERTLDSIFKQSYQNLEIIMVYDDIDLQDLTIIQRLIKKKKNIKLIINKRNLGAARSRNKAIKYAKGRYLAFIDSDDTWKKNKLSKQIYFMKKNKYSFTHTSYNIISPKNKLISKRMAAFKTTYKNLLNSCDIGLSTVMIDKKNIKKIKFPNLITKEDYALWLKLSKKHVAYGLNQYLTDWKKVEQSLSSNITQKILDAFKVYYFYENLGFIKSIYRTSLVSVNFLKKNYF